MLGLKNSRLFSCIKRIALSTMCAAVTLSLLISPSSRVSGESGGTISSSSSSGTAFRNVRIFTDNGVYYSGFLRGDVTYVPLRDYSVFMGAESVVWDQDSSTAFVHFGDTLISAVSGGEYIEANGRYFWAQSGIYIENGIMYVPVRALSYAFGSTVEWDQSEYAVHASGHGNIVHGDVYYDSDAVYWLAKIIHAESEGESLTGKIAVGNVILNRVRSELYPNTIYGVIFDRRFGVQFTPTANGRIYNTPGESSIIAAKLCLEGFSVSDEILYFINESLAESFWVSRNCTFVVNIGSHDFYS